MLGTETLAFDRRSLMQGDRHREKIWLVQAMVSHAMGVSLHELCATTRGAPKAALARQVAMYLCHVACGRPMAEVARAFGRDPSTVAHALRRIEDLRDEAEFDRSLTLIEAMLQRAWGDA